MAILLQYRADRVARWQRALADALPGIEIRIWPDDGDPVAIEAVVTQAPPPGLLRRYPNARFVATTGAGIERLLAPEADIPIHLPIVRLVDETLTDSMAEYVLAAVLRYHRQFEHYEATQQAGAWSPLPRPEASERAVGVLGLGVLGLAAARRLHANGFPVLGWSRNPKPSDDIQTFHDRGGLDAMLGLVRVLVCLLPLTSETEGIVDRRLLDRLPPGAFFINVGRGAHVVDADLIAALDSGRLAHATLDVFRTEPLPQEHPFWRHPRVTITPHIASLTVPETAAAKIAETWRRARAGLPLANVVDRQRGY